MEHTTPRAAVTYKELCKDREPFLRRARDNADYTLPTLFPPEGHNGHDTLRSPNQNFASDAVNVLSSKLVIGLFPAGVPIFKQKVPKRIEMELTQGDPDALAQVQGILGLIEIEATDEMEAAGWRPVLHACNRNLIVGGNYMLHSQPDNKLRGFNLNNYVTRRDHAGNHVESVVQEMVDLETLPEDTRAMIEAKLSQQPEKPGTRKQVKLYTHIHLKAEQYKVYQECEGVIVEGTEGSYPKDRCPWLPVRWMAIEGEHYGRSMVEDHLGDIVALDIISKGIKEAVALGTRVVTLVRPGSMTNIRDLVRAKNGDVIKGREEDIGSWKLDKQVDLSVAERWADRLEARLGKTFLLHSAVQRQGERVTLGEIRYMINELNDALGGIYATLAIEMQRPLIMSLLHRMRKSGTIPRLKEADVKTTLVTGLDALSREHDLQNLTQAAQLIASMFGPEAVAQYVHPSAIIQRIFSNLRIDPDGALKSKEELEAQAQQDQQAQVVQQLGPDAMKMLQAQQNQQGTPA